MKNKEPLFHIVKRDDLSVAKVWGIRLLAILLALVLCEIVTVLLTKLNPLDVYGAMIKGAFGSKRKTWVTAQNTSILLRSRGTSTNRSLGRSSLHDLPHGQSS